MLRKIPHVCSRSVSYTHLDVYKRQAEHLAQIQAEMRDYKTICDDKVSEVLKKQEDTIKELKDDNTKRFEEVWETRESDRQEVKLSLIHI